MTKQEKTGQEGRKSESNMGQRPNTRFPRRKKGVKPIKNDKERQEKNQKRGVQKKKEKTANVGERKVSEVATVPYWQGGDREKKQKNRPSIEKKSKKNKLKEAGGRRKKERIGGAHGPNCGGAAGALPGESTTTGPCQNKQIER